MGSVCLSQLVSASGTVCMSVWTVVSVGSSLRGTVDKVSWLSSGSEGIGDSLLPGWEGFETGCGSCGGSGSGCGVMGKLRWVSSIRQLYLSGVLERQRTLWGVWPGWGIQLAGSGVLLRHRKRLGWGAPSCAVAAGWVPGSSG